MEALAGSVPSGCSPGPPEAWMIEPEMVEAQGCPTQQRQGQHSKLQNVQKA
jgi:hypothetical protein